jgi:serine/threonine protein kinase
MSEPLVFVVRQNTLHPKSFHRFKVEFIFNTIQSIEEGYNKNVDWWSFGAVIYEMLTGAPPFYSSDRKEILKHVVSKPVPIPDYLSPKAKSLLEGLL